MELLVHPRPLKYQLRTGDQLLFLHIPKTGGTTLYLFLLQQFSETEVWPLDVGPFEDQISDGQLEDLSRYKLLRSHYDYTSYKFFTRKPVYLTMLRDPVERVMSIYKHMHRDPANEVLREVLKQQLTLEEFAQYPLAQGLAENRQVKQIAGILQGRARSPEEKLSKQAMLEIALMRLDEFAFFGLVERMDESIQLLCHTFNWPTPISYKSQNIAPTPTNREDLSESELEAIENANQLDIELYNHALRLFDYRMSRLEEVEPIKIRRKVAKPQIVGPGAVILPSTAPRRTVRGTVIGWLGKIRRRIIPEGSDLERKYFRIRYKYFGW
jgi:hypothetical protein